MVFGPTFRTSIIQTLRRAPKIGSKRHITQTAKLLARIVPVHVSAINRLNLVPQSVIRKNIRPLEEAIKQGQIDETTIERVLFGTNKEQKMAMQENFKVKMVRFELAGEVVEGPMILASDYQAAGTKPLSFLIHGSIRELKLAEDQTSITLRPPAPPASTRARLENHSLKGVAASPGYGFGAALQWLSWSKGVDIRKYEISEDQAEAEIARFHEARAKAEQVLQREISRAVMSGYNELVEVLEGHKLMVADQGLADKVVAKIQSERFNAEHILEEVISQYIRRLEKSDNEYMRARITDFRDTGNRILKALCEVDEVSVLEGLKDDVVIVAQEITPADISSLHLVKERIKGIVTEHGGPTSHAAIISRSLGIPALVGTKDAMRLIRNGDKVALYGGEGVALVNPNEASISEFLEKQRVFGILVDKISREVTGKPAQTRDGVRVILEGNIAANDELPMVEHFGGEGVGLFRTEFEYMNREEAPSEDELFQVFANIMGPARVRTFDFGGDKILADYMPHLSPEDSSFLGLRGVRLYFHDEWWGDMFRAQLKAILRASVRRHELEIMFPMISIVEELRAAKRVLEEVKSGLQGDFNPDIKVGVMIEVPSAVGIADELAREADFFSIGTNDLVQYILGVARENELVAHLYDPFHRAVLQNFARTISAAKGAEIPVGVCGAMAASPLGAAVLVGMGADSLSMPPADIPMIKYALSGLEQGELQQLVEQVLNNGSVGKEMLAGSGRKRVAEFARETLSLESFERLSFLERNLRSRPI